jgi:hypothetical protein
MIVRIQFGQGTRVSRRKGKNRRLALAAAALLTPVCLLSFVLAVWRLAADMNWANSFAIPSGLFSHWQVWLGAAAALQGCSYVLNRYGHGGRAIS